MVARAETGGREGERELLFKGYRVLVLQEEKSFGDWLRNNLKVISMNCTLKNH